MFHRFSAAPVKSRGRKSRVAHAEIRTTGRSNDRQGKLNHQHRLTWTTEELDESDNPNEVFGSGGPTAKRQKIARACERCRLQRVKCDERKPCLRCVKLNLECIVSGLIAPSLEENAAILLSDTVRDADAIIRQDETRRVPNDADYTIALNTPEHDDAVDAGDATLYTRGPGVADSPASGFYSRAHTSSTQLCEPNVNQGTLSQDSSADESGADIPNCHYKSLNASIYIRDIANGKFPQPPCADSPSDEHDSNISMLHARQRVYHLRLFWEVFQPLLQVVSDGDIHRLNSYPSPTDPTDHAAYSVQHALVDSMIALAIQHSLATGLVNRILDGSSQAQAVAPESSWPGFQHIRWCRERMRKNEDVCLDALRAHALMALYFVRGNSFREAYNLLGITIRKAYIARLHRPPPGHLPEEERTARMQLWWLFFSLDIQCSLQLGSPVACQPSLIKCPQPSMDALYRYVGAAADATSNDHSSSAYCIFVVHLATVMADISTCVSSDDLDEASNLAIIEEFSNSLVIALVGLEVWRDRLPEGLRIGQQDTDAGQMRLDHGGLRSKWLQRQAILLELKYHHAYVMFQRPCIRMLHITSTATVVGHIKGALSHSFAIIEIMFAVSSQSDIIYGWVEAFQSLWTAALTIVAYITTYRVFRPNEGQNYHETINTHRPSSMPESTISQCFFALSRVQLILNAFSHTCPGVLAARGILSSLVENLQISRSAMLRTPPSRPEDVLDAGLNQPKNMGTVLFWDEDLARNVLVALG